MADECKLVLLKHDSVWTQHSNTNLGLGGPPPQKVWEKLYLCSAEECINLPNQAWDTSIHFTRTHTDKPVSYENEHEGWFHPDVMPSP